MLPYLLKCLYCEHDRSYFEHVFMKIIANIKDSTDKKNILRILSDINNGIFYSQRKISKQLGISVGLSNLYVKRCLKKGWIKLKTVPKKRYIYYLTPKGFIEKSKLTAEYLSSSFSLYRNMREDSLKILTKCKKKNKRIILHSEGELSEVFILTAKEINLDFDGIVIPNSNIKNFFGIKVFSKVPKNIETIILCDIKSSHNTFLQLKRSFPNKKIIVPEILNIKKNGS